MELLLGIWPVLAFIAVQTVAIAWWAATITAKVNQLDKDMGDLSGSGERFVRIETLLQELNKKFDTMNQTKRGRQS